MSFTTPFNPNALQSDGAQVSEQIINSTLPSGVASGAIGISGGSNWGKIGVGAPFVDAPSALASVGDTLVTAASNGTDYGIVARAILAGFGGANYFIPSRDTDGTDTAAAYTLLDAAAGKVLTISGLWTGSFGNRIAIKLELISGTTGANPVFRLTATPPGANPQTYTFNGFAGSAGAYSGVAFRANAMAAINGGGVSNTPGSIWIIASVPTGATNVIPVAGTFAMTGGTDGTTGLTDALVMGTDGLAAARTGVYALRGLVVGGQIIAAGVTTTAVFASLANFCTSEGCISGWSFPENTPTATAIASRQTNALSHPFMFLFEDWVQYVDPALGARYLEPAPAGLGIVAAQPPYLYPGNKPRSGMQGILASESTVGVPIAVQSPDADQREQNGINWVGNPIPRGNLWGLYHGMMSDGVTKCSDVRMACLISLQLKQILGTYVGEMQTTDPSDDTRQAARGAVNSWMNTLLPPNTRQIQSYEDILDNTDNTQATIAQSIMLCRLLVTTMNAVRFAIGLAQVGSGLALTVQPAQA